MTDLSVYFNSLKRPRDYSARREKEGRLPCRVDSNMTLPIRIANNSTGGMDMVPATYMNYYEGGCLGISDFSTIEIYARQDTEFTAEELLSMCAPFGYVICVQKIATYGLTWGLVTYSNADDAAVAKMKLNSTPDSCVGMLKTREESLLQCSDRPSHRLPSLLDTLYAPAYSQNVFLRIGNLPKRVDQRYQVLSLLPPGTTHVKVQKKSALVMLPDVSSALWLIDFLNDLYTGSKRLRVSFANQGGGACPASRAARRKRHRQHPDLL